VTEFNQVIGGFFELEKPEAISVYHEKGIGLSNGRSCLSVIVDQYKPSTVYVPYYCCDTLLEPLEKNKIKIAFYSINQKLEATYLPDIKHQELFLYINYFGIKKFYANYLVKYYQQQIIIDNTHDYFTKGFDEGSSFNSSRKYFGVPDGGYLYTKENIGFEYPRNKNFITDHLTLKLDGRQEEAFISFKRNELTQNCQPFRISMFSESILEGINYDLVRTKRIENFNFYQRELGQMNQLENVSLSDNSVPFCYPFMVKKEIDLSMFYNRNIFIPVFWKEVLDRKEGFIWEKELTKRVLPLPIDHRYNFDSLKVIVNLIKEII
jgi:hypothetical protein